MIEILSSGVLNTVQDLGRPGWLASGVSLGGAMDRQALEVANLLVGNAPDAAGLEIQLFPFRLRTHVETTVAWTVADGEVAIDDLPYPPWWAAPLRPGQTLALKLPRSGVRGYVAFAGGIEVPPVLGSRSTDVRGRFGGFEGRGLERGDRLTLGPAAAPGPALAAGLGAVPPERAAGAKQQPIRVIKAAQYEDFTEAARQALVSADWTVTAQANRMGYGLSGPALPLTKPLELFSHGIMPGTVQVPPSSQPIIQLADANTCGGYPKIATVIDADLWRLAQAPVGATLRFMLVEPDGAVEALRAQAGWSAELASMRRLLGAH